MPESTECPPGAGSADVGRTDTETPDTGRTDAGRTTPDTETPDTGQASGIQFVCAPLSGEESVISSGYESAKPMTGAAPISSSSRRAKRRLSATVTNLWRGLSPCALEDRSEQEQRLVARGVLMPPLKNRPVSGSWPEPPGKVPNKVMEQVWREERESR